MDTVLPLAVVFLFPLMIGITIDDCPITLPRDRYLRAFSTSCYQFVLTHERDFATAERECESRRGHLVIVRDAATQNFLYLTLKNDFHFTGNVFIGLSDEKEEGTYVWVDGSSPHYTHWAPGQPGLAHWTEDCVVIAMEHAGGWDDYPCEDNLFGAINGDHYFICEFPTVSQLPTTTTLTTTTSTTTTSTSTSTTPTTTTTPTPTTTTPEPRTTTTTTHASTTSTTNDHTTTITTKAPATQCQQCGDYDNDIPCTEEDLNIQATPCGQGLHYCMTDASKISADSNLTIYKRCVDELTCVKEYYLQNMQSDLCRQLDVTRLPDILVCHLCCHGDACNSGIVPDPTSLYVPWG